jgi:amino acid transporter
LADLEQSKNGKPRTDQDLDARLGEREHSVHPDLTMREVHRGKHQGDKYVRVIRSSALRKVAPGILRASEAVSRPSGKIGRWYTQFKAFLVGKPLPSEAEKVERLNKIRALAVFSSDAISSSAYATEEILIVMVMAGAVGLVYSVPIALAIAILLAIVSFSYRQTVHAYPHGGGSYTVSRENLGTQAGLIAAAALLIDYILTVAVSISAGTAAITSAMPELFSYRVEISVAFIVLITLINLRGIRESGTIFAAPTYLFIFSLAGVILLGTARWLLGDLAPAREPQFESNGFEPVTLFMILHAFAAGSVAMSGTEAIANGVPSFQAPESKNAAATLTWMALILGAFFVGVTFLAQQLGITPRETETVISQVGRTVLGAGVFYGIFQAATMLILVLAANTSFSGFPRLAYVMARDGFMPHQLTFRGDRLAFTNGIVVLGVVAAALVILFGGSTHALIPLYAVGVFLSFTLSQAGMVRHWWKTREPRWKRSAVINGTGAILTAIILGVVWSVKFQQGAWIVFIMIPLLVLMFNGIHRHYQRAAEQLVLEESDQASAPLRQIVIVPVGDLNKASLRALRFAHSIAKDPLAVRIFYEPEEVGAFRKEWARWGDGTQVVFLESPYRSFNEPLLAYLAAIHRQDAEAYVTIVLPESIPAHWWEHFLHNQTALRLKTSLLFRKNTVVIDVPYHLDK